jgi:translation initiation factor 1A
MPKKKKCGKNSKSVNYEKRQLIEADIDGQVYGIIEKALGDRYFDVNCMDKKKRRCRVRSKRLKIQLQDYVIVALREFDDNNADIIHKYDHEEIKVLQEKNLLPASNILGSEKDTDIETIEEFDFEDI